MTSNRSKIITNERAQTGRNSSSEESEKKARTKPHQKKITHIREEDNTGGEPLVEEIRKDDPEYGSDHDDDRQKMTEYRD